MIDVKKIRKDFTIYNNKPNLVYLNSSATSLKPKFLFDSILNFYNFNITTIGKSFDIDDKDNWDLLKNSLNEIGKFIGAPKNTVIPSYGTTESLNKISSYFIDELKDGDEIILGSVEHSSNILPWINYAKHRNKKIVFKWYKIKDDFTIDLDDLKKLVNKKTKLISIAHIYNTFGTENNIKDIRKVVGNNVKIVVDAAQSIGHIKINVKDMDCDYLVFGAHKVFGPHGLGFMYIKNLMDQKHPFQFGGNMNQTYSKDDIVYRNDIYKFIPGTQSLAEVFSFLEIIKYINSIGIENICEHNSKLKEYAESKLEKIPNLKIINKGLKSSILLFEIKNVSAEDVAYHLSKDNIILRPGSSCVKIKNNIFNENNLLRVSFHIYNDNNDIDKLYKSLLNGGDFLEALFKKREAKSICK